MSENVNYFDVSSNLNWDEYFMLQAIVASFKSKDPTRKVGAVFVDNKNHLISMGYNGFIAGLDETKLPWGKDESQPLEHRKHGYVVHAETNALLHSPASRDRMEGARLYVTLFPCNECAKLVASLKIKEIIFISDRHSHKEYNRISKRIFDLAGITYRKLEMGEGMVGRFNEHFDETLKA